VRCFSIYIANGGGDCGRAACSIVALNSLARKSRGHSGAVRRLAFLGKGENKATCVFFELALF
jgi:hypothetical protein